MAIKEKQAHQRKNRYARIDAQVRRAQGGDKTAKEMLLMTFKPLILSIINQMNIPAEDRDDAFQDGMVFFLEGIQKFDRGHGAGFNAFIKTHMGHYFKKRQSGRYDQSVKVDESLNCLISDSKEMTLQDTLVDESTDIEGDYVQRVGLEAVRKGIRRGLKTLTASQTRLILAHYHEGLSLRACARKWGVSLSSIRVQHKRALKKIKKFLS